MELRDKLPPELGGRIPLDSDVKSTFPVDLSRKVVVQPFLLIVRRDGFTHLSDCHDLPSGTLGEPYDSFVPMDTTGVPSI
jgi:hypothetical protein